MSFPEVKHKLGLGCMRLTTIDDDNAQIDLDAFSAMIDYFIEQGFNYFDTARPYHGGASEKALKTCLTSRYPREAYLIANKLSGNMVKGKESIRPVFASQLETVGVDYFDFYLMHAMNADRFLHYKEAKAIETALTLKDEGKIRHVGMSFHDSPQVLDEILTAYPELEFVQIQYNYLDIKNPVVESQGVYDICRKHQKPIIIMEPVKGGQLVNLTDNAQQIINQLDPTPSNAELALRFAAQPEGVFMVLSGMSNMSQLKENIEIFKDLKPLSQQEEEAALQIRAILEQQNRIDCTNCRYCVETCPQSILIPDLFTDYNDIKVFNNWMSYIQPRYNSHTTDNGKASSCIECGICEDQCPQFLPIRQLLKDVADLFEQD